MKDWTLLRMVILVVCLWGGCSYERAGVASLEQRVPRCEKSIALTFPADSNEPVFSVEPTGVVTLHQAISFALMHNPELHAYYLEIRAAEARRLQAGLRPNPEIGIEVENFGGSGAMTAVDSAETTIQLGQLIELSGKRVKRRRLADIEKDLVRWDYESKRWDVYADVARAFVTVLAAQENLARQEEIVAVSEQMEAAVASRVEAGKDPALERTKAEVALAKTRIGRRQITEKLKSARQQLAATWGCTEVRFEKVAGEFDRVSFPPPQTEVVKMLSRNPQIARLNDEIEARHRVLTLEKAKAVPDPVLFGGMRYLAEDSDSAFVFSLGIPIPLFDRNQGGIMEAGYELAKARKHRKAVQTEVHALLLEAYQRLSATYDEVTALKSQVLPGARSAFDSAREGYGEGKFDYLSVLDAQRTLFDTQTQYIEALLSYHMARIDLERLTIQPIEPSERMRD